MASKWIYFRIGDKVGLIPREVYNMFLAEMERLQSVTDSDKITPNFGAMVVNSATTPLESLM